MTTKTAPAKTRKTPVKKAAASAVIKSEVRKGIVLQFEVTDYIAPEHKGGRPKEPNPYAEGIAMAVKLRETDAAKQITVTIPKADVDAHKRWIRIGMNEAGFSASTVVTAIEGDETNVRLSFRATPKVERKRKTKAEKEAAAAAAAAALPTDGK